MMNFNILAKNIIFNNVFNKSKQFYKHQIWLSFTNSVLFKFSRHYQKLPLKSEQKYDVFPIYNLPNKSIPSFKYSTNLVLKSQILTQNNRKFIGNEFGHNMNICRLYSSKGSINIHDHISSLKSKKRNQRKKVKIDETSDLEALIQYENRGQHHRFLTFDPIISLPSKVLQTSHLTEFQIVAYATADEYDLEDLSEAFREQGLYDEIPFVQRSSEKAKEYQSLSPFKSSPDFLQLSASYQVSQEPRTMFVFREGVIVFWNVPSLERKKILSFIETYEAGKYSLDVIKDEAETLVYTYSELGTRLKSSQNMIFLNENSESHLEKFAFSHALAMSVKLGIWESSLDKYIDNIEFVTEKLSESGVVVLTQQQVLQRMGQLFALRHLINLSSDLLDTPDIYWEHDYLEQLYNRMSNHLNINKRTSVMNTKLNHCVELMEILKSDLNDRHSSRLEWIIIILIMIEVFFEILHFL